ncbi:lipocalin-like domain-containing protein [Protofrankia symbiont of Coriaria ruscifolia]|uniref:lipocalin-like domain-containing protein n=1 Tax=Protofrankia symbiont of Coriaria ruscifolia TaxID=1306542 RepID=UPI0010418C23|nr:lipocalin-like domain-containing protein [Protofrankia symbiont of Coriaria ruscifolia]
MSSATSSGASSHRDARYPSLAGVWQLISFIVADRSGNFLSMPMGAQPSGLLIYTVDGHMSVHLRDPRRHTSSTSVPEFAHGSHVDAESIAMNHPYIGYCGTYRLSDDQVIHHVQAASVPEWIGENQVRDFALRRDVLTLCCPAKQDGSDIRVPYLTWERIRSAESPEGATVAP